MNKALCAALLAASVAAIKIDFAGDAPESRDELPPRTVSNLLVTTGYWRLTNNDADNGGLRNGPNGYLKRMHLVMTLNVPIHVYGDEFGVNAMKDVRGSTTPALVGAEVLDFHQFEPCKSHEKMMRSRVDKYTHALHMHSISLGCIWDGKMSLIAKSAKDHPGYKWYGWLDIGMHGGPEMDKAFHDWDMKRWPNYERLNALPMDKLAAGRTGNCHKTWDYCHMVAATTMIMPYTVVENITNKFYSTVDRCMQETMTADSGFTCLNEQAMLTQMELHTPGLLHGVGKGYGSLASAMTMQYKTTEEDFFSYLGGEEGAVKQRL